MQEGAYGLWKPGVAGSIPARLTEKQTRLVVAAASRGSATEKLRREALATKKQTVVEGWCPVRADISDVLGSIPRATTVEKREGFETDS